MNQMNPRNGYSPIFFKTSVESRRLFSHSLGSHRHSQQPNRWFERNVGMSSDQAMISHQGIRPPPRLLQTQTTSTVVVSAQEAYTPYNTVTVQKPVQRLDTPPHVDSPGSYASTSSDQEVPHYLNTNGVSSIPRTKQNVARLAQQRMALTGNEEGPTVRQHLQQQQAASKLLASASTREPNSQSPGPNGPFTEPSMPPAPPRRQRSRNNGRAKNQAIAQQLSMPVQPIVRVGVPPPTAIPTTSASPPTVGGTQGLYGNHVQQYQNHYQNAPSPNRQQVVPRQRPSAPTPAHPQNVQIVVGPRPSPMNNDPEMGQRFQVGRPNSQGYLPPQNQQYRVKIQQLEKGEELDTQRIYGARQQPHPSQIQRPSAPVPPSPNNEENRFRYNSGESSKSSYDEYNEIVPQVSNPYQSVQSGPPSSSLPQSSQHYNLHESLSNNNHSFPPQRLMINQPNASNHHQVLFQQQNSISSQPGPPTSHFSSSSQSSQSHSDLQPSDPPIGNHLAVQQALRKRVKDRRKKENEPSDDTDISDNQNISMELPEETFDNFNLSGGDLDDVDDDFLQIFAADEEREFHPVSTNPMDLDKELGLLSEEGLDVSGDLLQQLCGTDQITLSKELFDEFVETFQAEESEEKTKDRPVSRQTARTQQELQQQQQHQQQQLQRHHLMQQQLRQQQLGEQLSQAQAAHLQRQHSQQQLKQLLQQRNPEDGHPMQIQNQQLARIQALRQAQSRPNTPLDPYSQQQLEAHRGREKEDMYRRKSRFMRRSINALVYENAALCDEVGRLNQRIQTVVEERKSLAKRLNHFEKNHLRRLNTAKKKKEEAARQREQNLATLEAERTKEQIKAAAAAAAAAAMTNLMAQEEMLHRERSLDEMVPSPKKRPRSSLPSPRSSSIRKRISEEQISQEVNVLLQGIKADQQSRVSARMAQGSPIKLPATVARRDSFRRESLPFNRLSVTSSSDVPLTTPLSISPASDSSIVLPPMLNGENSPGIPRNLSAPLLVQKSPVKYSQSMPRVNEVKEELESPHDSPQRNSLLEKKRERRPKVRKNGEEDGIKIELDSSETPSPREMNEHKMNLDNLSDQTSRDGDRMLRKRHFTATPEVPEMPGAKRRRTTRGSSLATNEDEAEFPRDVKREDDDREDPEVGPIDESIVADILREVRRRRREMSRDTSESRSIRSTPAPDTPDTPSTDERSRRSSRTRPPRALVSSSPTPIPPTPPPESLKDSSEPRSLRLRDRKIPSSDLTHQPKTTRTNLERAVKRKS